MVKKTKVNLRSLRNLRVLRPLRSINIVPTMRKLVSTLINSMPELFNVAIFLIFIFMLFGILGLQLYSGQSYNKCRTTPKPINSTYWPYSEEINRPCSKIKGGFTCPKGLYCGNPSEYGIDLKYEEIYNNPGLQYGIANFDNIFQAILAVFEIITKTGWINIIEMVINNLIIKLPQVMNTHVKAIGVIFCVSVTMLGSFFLMNLILAVII